MCMSLLIIHIFVVLKFVAIFFPDSDKVHIREEFCVSRKIIHQ